MIRMKEKTRKKLERKFLALPLHHIDTSVILEPPTTEVGRVCRKYLQLLTTRYRSKLSFPVIGELLIKVLQTENTHARYAALDSIMDLLKDRKISIYVPEEIGELIQKIRKLDTRIIEIDAHIVACAVEDKALTLATLDKELLHNDKIEKEFNLEIKHPDELV